MAKIKVKMSCVISVETELDGEAFFDDPNLTPDEMIAKQLKYLEEDCSPIIDSGEISDIKVEKVA